MTKGLVRESVSIAFTVWLLASALPIAQCQPAPDNFDIKGRLRMALQIARESNDRKLVAAVESTGRAFSQGLPEDADTRLRQLEKQVGIDPGGWSMAGFAKCTDGRRVKMGSQPHQLAAVALACSLFKESR